MTRTFQMILGLNSFFGIFLGGLLLASSQTWHIPGAAETPGQFGARFSSTLFMANLGSTPTSARIELIPYQGKPVPPPANRSLAPNETIQIPAVLQSLFGLSADAGTLIITSDAPLALWMSTANIASPVGTYGLALQPLSSSTLLTAGATANAIWVNQASGSRTNIALALLDPNSSVEVTVYDEQNRKRGSTLISSPTPASWQAPVSELIGPTPLVLGRVELAVIQGRAAGYTAVVDNITNDGIAVIAEMVRSDATDFLLDGVAHTPGANGTYWSSDIRIFNPDSSALVVNIDSLGFAGGNSTLSRTVPAFGLTELVDVLGPVGFGYPQGVAGALRVRAASPFLLAGRTSNRDPSGNRPGTFSAFQRPISYSYGFLSGSSTAVFVGVNQTSGTSGFRTNLAFLAGMNGATGDLILRDNLGVQNAITPFSFVSGEWVQKNMTGWFPGMSIPVNSRVDVQVTSGTLDGYASRIDNGTGDAVVLPLIPLIFGVIVGAPQIAGCPVFPPDNPWNRDISNDPVDPNSSNYIAHMNGNTKFLHADFGSDPTYGIPYVVVAGTQPKVPMTFLYADESDPGPYPIPPDAPIEGGSNSTGDRHILVLDKDKCLLYETYDSHFVNPGLQCGSGAIFDLHSNQLRPDGWTSADAAGLPILPGLVRYDEAVLAGEIKHAVRFTVQSTQRAYIHPATHFASSNTDPNAPPMGLRVRLKASYDLSRFTGTAKVILTALKKYGMIVADNGSDWFITGATDSRWDDEDLNQLKTVPGSVFEVVQSGSIAK